MVSRSLRRGRRDEAKRTGRSPYELLLRQIPEEPTPLLVVPYFTSSGTPYFDLHTPGVIYGLRMATSQGEFMRGLLEGVAYEMRVNTEILARSGVAIREFRATGGGAMNARWNQLKADLLGIPISTISTTEAGCCGVALLGAAAKLGIPIQRLADQWVRPQATFEPHAERHAFYSEQFLRYKELYQAVRKISVFCPPSMQGNRKRIAIAYRGDQSTFVIGTQSRVMSRGDWNVAIMSPTKPQLR